MAVTRRLRAVGWASGATNVHRRPSARIERRAGAGPPTSEEPAPDEPGEPLGTRRTGRRWWRRLLFAAGLVVLCAVAYAAWVFSAFLRFENQIYKPRPSPAAQAVRAPVFTATPRSQQGAEAKTTPEPASPTALASADLPSGRLNILLMGTDKRENDPDHYARSDSMILANVDTSGNVVRLMSIPRDLVVSVPGYGTNKINAAYMLGEYYKEPGGGQALAAEAISQFFNVPVDYYVALNFNGFREVIDSLGGIYIDVPYEIDDYHYPTDDEGDPFGEVHLHFDAGWQHMDGKTALRYARTRHADNDFMRSRRQLQVMLAARQAALNIDIVPKLPSLIDRLAGMVETDIPLDKQVALARFGSGLRSSNIITSSIGSDLIYAVQMDDGSEGLKLDWQAARPMLTDFFGSRAMSLPKEQAAGQQQERVESTPSPGKGSHLPAIETRAATPSPEVKTRNVPASRGATRLPTPLARH